MGRQSEAYEKYRIIHGQDGKLMGRKPIYDPELHPGMLVQYFQDVLDRVNEVERIHTERGDVKYVQAPVPPPTVAGFAAEIEVTRECLWSWGKKHPEFEEAINLAKAIQEDIYVRMGALGAYAPQVMILMMKNFHGWTDRNEQTHTGDLTLQFDKQDSEA